MKCPKCAQDFILMDLIEHVCRRQGASPTRTLVAKAWDEAFAAGKISGVMRFSVTTLAGLLLQISKGEIAMAKERLTAVMSFLEKIEEEEAPPKKGKSRGAYKKKEAVQ